MAIEYLENKGGTILESTYQHPENSLDERTFIKANKSDVIKPSFYLKLLIGPLRVLVFYLITIFLSDVLKMNLDISLIIGFFIGPFLVELAFYKNVHRKYRILAACPTCNANLPVFPSKAMLKKAFVLNVECKTCSEKFVVDYSNEYH